MLNKDGTITYRVWERGKAAGVYLILPTDARPTRGRGAGVWVRREEVTARERVLAESGAVTAEMDMTIRAREALRLNLDGLGFKRVKEAHDGV